MENLDTRSKALDGAREFIEKMRDQTIQHKKEFENFGGQGGEILTAKYGGKLDAFELCIDYLEGLALIYK